MRATKKGKCRKSAACGKNKGRTKGREGEGRGIKGLTSRATLCKRESCREYSTFVLRARSGRAKGWENRGGKGETSVGRDPIKWRLINSRAQNAYETCASIGSVIIKTLPRPPLPWT